MGELVEVTGEIHNSPDLNEALMLIRDLGLSEDEKSKFTRMEIPFQGDYTVKVRIEPDRVFLDLHRPKDKTLVKKGPYEERVLLSAADFFCQTVRAARAN